MLFSTGNVSVLHTSKTLVRLVKMADSIVQTLFRLPAVTKTTRSVLCLGQSYSLYHDQDFYIYSI